MKRRSLMIISSLFLLTSCADLTTGRSFLTEMEHDDSRFFSPRRDFPVIGGDDGRDWNTDEETIARTPASARDLAEENRNRALREELRDLEGSQADRSMEQYQQYKGRFNTISERIYFLELPPHERQEYLEARGFVEKPKTEFYTPNERKFAVRQNDILLGMTKNDVVESWGKPVRIEIAGNPSYENERWVYRTNNGQKMIYFEAGQVQGWE